MKKKILITVAVLFGLFALWATAVLWMPNKYYTVFTALTF